MPRPLRIDAPPSGSGPQNVNRHDVQSEDPRIARIRAVDPDFDPRGKSDTYLDVRIELIDKAGAYSPTPRRSEQPVADASTVTPAPPTKSKLDEALDRADAEARAEVKAGPPACAQWKRTQDTAAPRTSSVVTAEDGDGSALDRANARAAADARAAYQGGPPACAQWKK